jgi:hypothetical protein
MTPTQTGGSSSSTTADSAVQAPAAIYMLTLCSLASPATIKPPRAPQLKKFKFFTSRSRRSGSTEQLYLHMGYFATLTEAQNWAQLMRRAYPQAIATAVPAALLSHPNSGVPTLQPAKAAPTSTTLTDAQVLNILETRRVSPGKDETCDSTSSDISLLRPDGTNTRRISREAVVGNAPVCFALQLNWSVQPIDFDAVPLLSVFRAHTLYRTEGHREGRSWYSLRLGFFSDAISAKQVASYVRSTFSSVAVVPITEEERTHASDTRIDTTTLSDTFGQQFDQALDADRAREAAAPASSVPTRSAQSQTANSSVSAAAPRPAMQRRPSNDGPSITARNHGRTETLEQTLELLASSEIWDGGDSPGESGVRHVTIEVQKRSSGP